MSEHDARCERVYTDSGFVFIDCLCHMRAAQAKAWATGHMLGEALAYNALADLLWRRHREVITRAEYRELRAARVASLPHWDTNPHEDPATQPRPNPSAEEASE